MALTVGELVAYMDVDQTRFSRGLAAARAAMASTASAITKHLNDIADDQRFQRFAASLDRAAVSVLKLLNNLSNIPTAVQGIAGLASIAKSASGALGVLPGILVSVAAAFTAVKVGVSGFADALKEMGDPKAFAEALKQLSPAARAAAIAIKQQAPAWREVKKAAQEALFSGIAPQLTKIGKQYAPVARDGLAGINKEFNTAVKTALAFGSSASSVKDVGTIFGNTRKTVAELVGGGLKPLLQILLDVVTVGTEFLPNLTGGFGNAAQAAADFVSKARESGRLKEWISGGLSILGDLWELLSNIGTIVKTVFDSFQTEGSGLLPILLDLTGRAKDFLKSVEGQQVLHNLASALKTIGDIVTNVLLTALRELAPLVDGTTPGLTELARVIGDVLTGAITTLAPHLVGIIKWLSDNMTWLGPVTVGILGLTVAIRAWGLATSVFAALHSGAAGKVIGDYAVMVARGIAAAATMVATWVAAAAGAVAQGAIIAAAWAATAAKVVAGWVMMGATALAQAARMALAWLIGMGPVGWAIAAVLAVVAVVITFWDDIVAATEAAWDAVIEAINSAIDWVLGFVERNWRTLLTIILGPLGMIIVAVVDNWEKIKAYFRAGVDAVISAFQWLGRLPEMIRGWMSDARDWANRKLHEVIADFKAFPGRIVDGLGNLGNLLIDTGRDIVTGLWNGIKAAGAWLMSMITGWIKKVIPGPILQFLGIASPSKLMAEIGRWIPAGLAKGIDGNIGAVSRAALEMAEAAAVPMPRNGGLPFTPPGLPAGTAGPLGLDGTAGRQGPLVAIENFHAGGDQSPDAIARDLAWHAKAKG
ncbi:hypothetical protein M8C13_04570 [Crossiella sp. SN42]|uniref:phage tail protein n=1 Tax=Crossiella sp. SN42 TaxID=2944808 RepID=UPI00207D18EE|nr:hypothetical protein [Crossiella sp. SN42]MCO1575033.1 hypothetical protein [Crossiella sp. SN42]